MRQVVGMLAGLNRVYVAPTRGKSESAPRRMKEQDPVTGKPEPKG